MLFDAVGGQAFFDTVVDAFYDAVEHDPVLLPLYPEGSDTVGARRRLSLFLSQYWGGPTTYSEERGHPRLRMRHIGFHIDLAARDAWLSCMMAAIDDLEMEEIHRNQLVSYVEMAAHSMVNQPS